MKVIIPAGGPVQVYSAAFRTNSDLQPVVLVAIEGAGGRPFVTLDPYQWEYLVTKIRAATSADDLGA